MTTLSGAQRGSLLRELLRPGRGSAPSIWVTCAGRSMEPTIRLGDRVRIEPCARPRAGEVVLFQGSRGLVLHRVVFRVPGTSWFLHIGDAGSGNGPGLAHTDQVIGRATTPRRLPSLSGCAGGIRRLLRAAAQR